MTIASLLSARKKEKGKRKKEEGAHHAGRRFPVSTLAFLLFPFAFLLFPLTFFLFPSSLPGDVPVSAPAGSCQIVAPQLDVAAGEEIRAPILLKGAPGFIGMEVDIGYDSAVVEALGADLGPLGANMLMDVGLRKPGLVVISLATAQSGPKGDGELLAVRFRVKGAAGQVCPLEFKHLRAWRSDNELEVPLDPVGGRLVVTSTSGAGSAIPWRLHVGDAGLATETSTSGAGSAIPWGWISLGICGLVVLVPAVALLRRRSPRAAIAPLPQSAGAPPPRSPAVPAFCSNCGAPLTPGAKFCDQCGQTTSQL